MIKYIKTEKKVELEANGDLLETAADIGYLLAQIYHRIAIPEAQATFKSFVQTMVRDRSPIWEKGAMVQGDVDDARTLDLDELIKQAGAGK